MLSKIDIENIENEARKKEAEDKNRAKAKRQADIGLDSKVYNVYTFTDKDNCFQKPEIVKEHIDRNRKKIENFNKECQDKHKEKLETKVQTNLNGEILRQPTCHSNKSAIENETVPM
jgi:hypothetical protein